MPLQLNEKPDKAAVAASMVRRHTLLLTPFFRVCCERAPLPVPPDCNSLKPEPDRAPTAQRAAVGRVNRDVRLRRRGAVRTSRGRRGSLRAAGIGQVGSGGRTAVQCVTCNDDARGCSVSKS